MIKKLAKWYIEDVSGLTDWFFKQEIKMPLWSLIICQVFIFLCFLLSIFSILHTYIISNMEFFILRKMLLDLIEDVSVLIVLLLLLYKFSRGISFKMKKKI